MSVFAVLAVRALPEPAVSVTRSGLRGYVMGGMRALGRLDRFDEIFAYDLQAMERSV